MEFIGGLLDNWHLEAFNNSDSTIPVTLEAFDIDQTPPALIGSTSRTVNPHAHEYLTLNTNGVHHTLAQIEYPQDIGTVILTLYGRNKSGLALPGAIFFNNQLIELENGVTG